jgi:tryptophan halogenase
MINVNKVVIVGGGSAGWMTAAYLIKTFPNKQIVVLESPDIPIVGVGESTLASITEFRDYLGIDEKDFMQKTNASYKMSIKFTDFYSENGGSFHYPFGKPNFEKTASGFDDWFQIKHTYPDTPLTDFVQSYFPSSFLFENNKFATNESGVYSPYNKKTDVAYHFDATMFGLWLKESYCIPRGVSYIEGTVVDAITSKNGIEALKLNNNSEVHADLFIDCTGFKSILLGGFLKEEFISYEDLLPNNSAWACQVPYKEKEKELEPFTHCTALKNGWCWNIPLWSRLGTGYVFSNKYISSDEALEEFKSYLMSKKMIVPRTKEEVESFDYRLIKMRVGIHKRTWVKNVVAIGLSAGFIEPLESNGLFTVTNFVSKLAKTLLREDVSKFDIDVYNIAVYGVFRKFAEFVAMHYALSHRDDSLYWQNINSKTFSKELESYTASPVVGFQDLQDRKMFSNFLDPSAGITYVSVGMGYLVFDSVDIDMLRRGDSIKAFVDEQREMFNSKKTIWRQASQHAPTLMQYLEKNIYGV